jgi:hypothetical protein
MDINEENKVANEYMKVELDMMQKRNRSTPPFIINEMFGDTKAFCRCIFIIGAGLFVSGSLQLAKPGYAGITPESLYEFFSVLAFSLMVVFPMAYYLGKYSIRYYENHPKPEK